VKELQTVRGQTLLVEQQACDTVELRRPRAVEAQHDLVADVDRGEARRRGEDGKEMVELVRGERIDLGPADGLVDPAFEFRPDLGSRQLDEGAVGHARRDPRFHVPPFGLRAGRRDRRPTLRPQAS